jgi:hypothetical protein
MADWLAVAKPVLQGPPQDTTCGLCRGFVARQRCTRLGVSSDACWHRRPGRPITQGPWGAGQARLGRSTRDRLAMATCARSTRLEPQWIAAWSRITQGRHAARSRIALLHHLQTRARTWFTRRWSVLGASSLSLRASDDARFGANDYKRGWVQQRRGRLRAFARNLLLVTPEGGVAYVCQ